MNEHEKIDFDKIVGEVFERLAQEAVNRVIQRHSGYGLDDGVKEIIQERTRELVKTPEIEGLIMDRMRFWMRKRETNA